MRQSPCRDILTTKKTPKSKALASRRYLGLTEQEFNRFRKACRTTLNVIAHEVMSAGVEVKGKTMRREHAIEVTLDADHLLNYGQYNTAQTPKMRKDWVRLYDERIRPLLDKQYGTPAFNRMMKKVFPATLHF